MELGAMGSAHGAPRLCACRRRGVTVGLVFHVSIYHIVFTISLARILVSRVTSVRPSARAVAGESRPRLISIAISHRLIEAIAIPPVWVACLMAVVAARERRLGSKHNHKRACSTFTESVKLSLERLQSEQGSGKCEFETAGPSSSGENRNS
jgi:hypothetical protein